MSARKATSRSERRQMVERMLVEDPDRSNRSISRAVGCSHELVRIVRGELESAGRIDPRNCRSNLAEQPHGGRLTQTVAGSPSAAMTHGATSPTRLAPLRLEGERFARQRWPWLDDARVALVSDLMARTELARRWLEDRGTVVSNRHGRVFPVAVQLDAWSRRLDEMLVRLDAEHRERGRVDPTAALEAHVAEIAAAREGKQREEER